ncbi:MAG: hypothetical protein JW915_19970 [Chitinispirillaceae bacterium]|nr:hypothetical protein [Chitinispirillaceae bacterium]
MLKGKMLKVGLGCLTLIGMSQATPIHETTKWQSIGKETIATSGSSNNGVFYSIDDGSSWLNLSSGLEFSVGQTVDFKVEIYKEFQGTHLSDVAKVWLDDVEMAKGNWALASNGNSKTVGWWWDPTTSSYYDGNVFDDSQNPITDLSKLTYLGSIGFEYTFESARDYTLTARTMCSDDLAALNTKDGNPVANTSTYIDANNQVRYENMPIPTAKDWKAFTATNPNSTLQGEIEQYTVSVRDVPEAGSLSLMLLGLTSLTGAFFVRKRK